MNCLKVRGRVRRITGKLMARNPRVYVTQTPIVMNTLTRDRKLYLFPEFHGI